MSTPNDLLVKKKLRNPQTTIFSKMICYTKHRITQKRFFYAHGHPKEISHDPKGARGHKNRAAEWRRYGRMSRKMHIKLKTKMMILFLAIILVPLLCGITVFMGYGYYENIDILHELSKKDIMIGAMVNRRLLQYMVVAMVVILILTSGIITAWLNRDVYRPLKELSVAMQHISVGDFDYHMNGGRGDEIGLLVENYEQMRLQLKESEEEKAQNEKKSKELVSNISHDLKTPITSIKGYVEGIMDGVANTPEKMDKYIKTIYSKANDMEKLINELTFYSGIDNNRIPYNFHRINVADYFGDCIEEVGLDLEQRNIELNYSNLARPDTMVIADPEQMKKVINNIISNSIKYMDKPRGVIDIRILDEMDSIRVEIEDNGKGIA